LIIVVQQDIYWKRNSKLFPKNKQQNKAGAVGGEWSGNKSHSRRDSEISPAPGSTAMRVTEQIFGVFLDHFPDKDWP